MWICALSWWNNASFSPIFFKDNWKLFHVHTEKLIVRLPLATQYFTVVNDEADSSRVEFRLSLILVGLRHFKWKHSNTWPFFSFYKFIEGGHCQINNVVSSNLNFIRQVGYFYITSMNKFHYFTVYILILISIFIRTF